MKNPIKNISKKIKEKRSASLKINRWQKKQSYNFNTYRENKDIKVEIEKRYNILTFIVIAVLLILVTSLFTIQVIGKEKYQKELKNLTKKIIYGQSAPRGRIYDRNGKLLVDNTPSKVIYYKKPSKVTTKDEIDIAYKLTNMINIDYIYTLMNKGYSYDEKVIKSENVTDEEYALVSENISTLKGINTKLDWDRSYPYGNTLKSILGSVSSSKTGLPSEKKEYYLKKGYTLDDRVGVSNIEYQYEDILKGQKNKYEVLPDGSYKLIEEGKRGQDIVLSIDIELQKFLEDTLTEEVLATKKEANTEYYDGSFAIITNPKTGEILAISGKKVINDNGQNKVVDYSYGTFQNSVTMGSVVKGASQITGYNTGALKIGEIRYDNCVKIAGTAQKCSWKPLGKLNDVTALAFSSNTYQYYTAIKVGKGNYKYNKPLAIDKEAFNTYRNTFAQFGLGVKTEIDLPNETTGYKGKGDTSGLLLDFSIGQYDNYTPVELAQYINTIADSGNRRKLFLMKGYYDSGKITNQTESKILNKVDTKEEYMNKVHEGFAAVLKYGLGAGYIDMNYKPAGKTGTSQSFVDTDGDGKIDKATISTTFAAYAPYDNPKVAFTIISPNVSRQDGRSNHQSSINKRLAQKLSKKYFEIYP